MGKIHKQKAAVLSLTMNVASVACAIEALDRILVEKGVLQADELMEKVKVVAQEHYAKGEMIPATED